MTALLWFRRDLRLCDLPPLLTAAQEHTDLLACFVLDPRLEKSAGARRLQFLGDCLGALNQGLNGRLIIVRGRPEKHIPLLCKEIGATSVHISADYSPFGTRRDAAVAKVLTHTGITMKATGSPYLVAPGRLLKSDGSPYKVFTPFFTQWCDSGWRATASSDPESVQWIDPDDVSATVNRCDAPNPGITLDIQAGELAALQRWDAFLSNGIDCYDQERNRPDKSSTSRLSADLKFGTIHPRTMVADIDSSRPGPRSYLRQLAFRDFYASVLHHWPHSAWNNWNPDFDTLECDTGTPAQEVFEAWKQGRTGYPIVDAGMRQLSHTGYMHNRVRMIAASFLIKDLHLPWQWGARWFLEQLIDGDIANNQHGWQWCAGSGTDAAPYFRVFNPTLQGKKFDPTGSYVRRWVPELAEVKNVHEPGSERPTQYPHPIVDHAAQRIEALRRYNAMG